MSRNHIQRRDDEQQSLGSYLAQGAGFLAFLLALFVVAGFRG